VFSVCFTSNATLTTFIAHSDSTMYRVLLRAARCYAERGYATVYSPSVCLSVSPSAISLKRGKVEPRLLWRTNINSHRLTRFRLVPKSITLDNLERPIRSPEEKMRDPEENCKSTREQQLLWWRYRAAVSVTEGYGRHNQTMQTYPYSKPSNVTCRRSSAVNISDETCNIVVSVECLFR